MRTKRTLILAAALTGTVIAAAITNVKDLLLLSLRGRTLNGEVVGSQPAARGRTATIRILLDGRNIELVEPCLGFECDPGETVPVTVLPADPSVHVAGDLKEQLWTAFIATFLVVPLMFGGAAAYSMRRVAKVAGATDVSPANALPGLKYLPVLVAFGALSSSVAGTVLGRRLAWLEITATVCLVLGSVAYVAWLRRVSKGRKAALAIFIVLFTAGLVLFSIDFF